MFKLLHHCLWNEQIFRKLMHPFVQGTKALKSFLENCAKNLPKTPF